MNRGAKKTAHSSLHQESDLKHVLRRAFDSVEDAVWVLDADQCIQHSNKAATAIFGKPTEKILGHPCWKIAHHTNHPVPGCPFQRMKCSRERESMDLELNGHWYEVVVDPLWDTRGKLIGAIHRVSDITERRRVEEALRESEERYRLLADHTEDFVSLNDTKGHHLYVSPSFYRRTGWLPDEVARMDWRKRLHPDDLPQIEKARNANIAGTPTTIEHRVRCKDGSWIWVETHCKPLRDEQGRVYRLLTWSRDITERRQAQEALRQLNATLEQRVAERTEALRESEERFRQMAENVQEVFWLADADLRKMLYVSPAFERLWGRSCESLYENPRLWFDAIHPDDRHRVQVAFLHKRTTEAPLEAEYRIVRPDGSLRWVRDLGSLIRDASGKPYRVAGVARDITERKEAELAKARLAAIVESSNDAISAMDLKGIITDWTQSAGRLYGYTAAEAIGQPISLIVPPDKRDEIAMFLEKLKRGERIVAYETERIHKDGRRLQVSLTISPIRDATGQIVGSSAIARDITERKRLQAEILRISETERQHFGRDLHDGLGQQLVAISLLADSLQNTLNVGKVPELAQVNKLAAYARAAVEASHDLARTLYPTSLQLGGLPTALTELARQVQEMFPIRCHCHTGKTGRLDDANLERQLYRIAQEAAFNAAKHSRGLNIWISLRESKHWLTLIIKDDGVGISEASLAVHDLGLNIMKYRAELIGAILTVNATPGQGTTVTCKLRKPSP